MRCLSIDHIYIGSVYKMVTFTKNMLNLTFDIKNIGLANVILEIKP